MKFANKIPNPKYAAQSGKRMEPAQIMLFANRQPILAGSSSTRSARDEGVLDLAAPLSIPKASAAEARMTLRDLRLPVISMQVSTDFLKAPL